jgi:nucleotide-binding universal stress UspA family protein
MTVMEQPGTARGVEIATVVLPVDFSSLSWQVLPLASHVARRFGATVRPFHVDTASPWLDETWATLQLRATPFGRSVSVGVTASASAVDGILRFAREDPDTLIAMSAHGHSGLGELALGSVCEGVLRGTDAAVLTAGPSFEIERHAFVRRIVACVDMTSGGGLIVPEALGWARALDVPLELVTVQGHPASSNRPVQEQAQRFACSVRQLSEADPRVSGLVLRGSRPAGEIVRHVAALRGTLLAMSTHARPAVARTILGSTASAVLRHSPTGLLLRHRP